MSKKAIHIDKRIIIAICSAIGVALVLFGGFMIFQAAQKSINANTETLIQASASLQSIHEKTKALFEDEKMVFLKKDIKNEEIDNLLNELDNIQIVNNEESQKNLDEENSERQKQAENLQSQTKLFLIQAKKQLEAQTAVNDLFTEVAIEGTSVESSPILSNRVTRNGLDEVRKSFYIQYESLNQWEQSINDLINDADAQMLQIEKAQEAISTVIAEPNENNYNSAESEVNLIKNDSIKQSLTIQLNSSAGYISTESSTSASGNSFTSNTSQPTSEFPASTVESTSSNNSEPNTNVSSVPGSDASSHSESSTSPATTDPNSGVSEPTATQPPSTVPTEPSLSDRVSETSIAKKSDQIVTVTGSLFNIWEKQDNKWVSVFVCDARVGKRGYDKTSINGKTPVGAFPILFSFGSENNPGSKLEYKKITGNSYWINDPHDTNFNTWQERDASSILDERLASNKGEYKYAMVIGYNQDCIPELGSSIFLHCHGQGQTSGSISIPESAMFTAVKTIRPNTYIIITANDKEISKY